MMILGEQAECLDHCGLKAMRGCAPPELAEMSIEDAGGLAFDEPIKETARQHFVDFVASVVATDAAPGWIAADEFTDRLAVAQ